MLPLLRAAFILRVKTGLQYRAAALAGMSTQFFMLIMIYTAFSANSVYYSESLPRTVTYV